MALVYHVYGNGGSGGPVDWTTILFTTSALSQATAPLAASSKWRFGVRAYDTVSGLEDQSVDAQVSINLDASQDDVTGLPPSPVGLSVVPLASGGYRVTWAWPFPIAITGFHVYLGTPTPNFSSAVATVPYTGSLSYSYTGTGLSDGVTYQVCVRAYNATGTEVNTVVAAVTGDASAPADVDSLTATTTDQS